MANKLDNPSPPRSSLVKQKETHSILSLINKRVSTFSKLQDLPASQVNSEKTEVTVPKLPVNPIPYDLSTAVSLNHTSLRFNRTNGRSLHFEMDKADGMGYSALIRLVSPESSAVTRFMIKDATAANKFIAQLISACKKDGCQLESDIRKQVHSRNTPKQNSPMPVSDN